MMNRVDICILCAPCQNVEGEKSTELKKKTACEIARRKELYLRTLCRDFITLLKEMEIKTKTLIRIAVLICSF